MKMYLTNRTTAFSLSLAVSVVAADLLESERRYHLDTNRRFDAQLAYSLATISISTTGQGVWVTPGTATLTFTGYVPVVAVSTALPSSAGHRA